MTELPSRPAAATIAILVGCAVTLLTGCSAQPVAPTTVTAQDLYDETEATWFAGPFDPSEVLDETADEVADPAGTQPDGPSTELQIESYGGAIPQINVDPNVTDPVQNPCDLVPLSAWQEWVGSDATQYEVDPGESCIYLEPADLTRMTFSYFRGGDPGTITTEILTNAEYLDGAGDQLLWVAEDPVAYASTLYMTAGEDLFVVTIYNANPAREADQKDEAIKWMTSALEGVAQ